MISPIEIAANAVITLSIVLAGRNSVHTWWTGILGCALFGMVFYQARLYAEVVLQLFFIAASCMGWWQWLFGAEGKPRPITRAGKKTLFWVIPFGILVTLGYGAMLKLLTDAYAPFFDSGVLVFSVVAQLLMIQRRLESWRFWLFVNTIAVPLYFSRELYLTSFLYFCYWINAIVAYRWWALIIQDHGSPTVENAANP